MLGDVLGPRRSTSVAPGSPLSETSAWIRSPGLARRVAGGRPDFTSNGFGRSLPCNRPCRLATKAAILARVIALVTAGGGFLLAVLWFDLMFDVQVLRHRDDDPPDHVLASIAAYYRRVTTEARPMNRLVALVMVGTIVATGAEIVRGDMSKGAAAASFVLAGSARALAMLHT